MKSTILIFLAALSVTTAAQAQAPAGGTTDPIQKALIAAPANLRENATVVRWNADFSHEVIKQGTNTLACYDRSGRPMQQPFSVECTALANLPRVKQSMELEAQGGGDRAKTRALVDAAEKAGTRVKPEFGSIFYNVNGADEANSRMHMTVALPGATTATLGLPETGTTGGAWIMDAGTSTAHLMIPGH